jgi:hypothetical protein
VAYLRKENETVEITYSLNKVWKAIQKVFASLEWDTEQIDDVSHHVKAKTKAGPISWGSLLLIDVVPVGENVTRVSVAAETPVTTISAIVDFGQTRRRIAQFFTELARQLTS